MELNIEDIASDMEEKADSVSRGREDMDSKHKSVLLNETIEGLNIKPDGIYVDGTLGGRRTCI